VDQAVRIASNPGRSLQDKALAYGYLYAFVEGHAALLMGIAAFRRVY